jgi:hypothetical protein
MNNRTRAERAQARVEQHKRRGSFIWALLTGNGDIDTLLPPFIVEVTGTLWKKGTNNTKIDRSLSLAPHLWIATGAGDSRYKGLDSEPLIPTSPLAVAIPSIHTRYKVFVIF